MAGIDARPRCSWALHSDLYTRYHDEEWGAPLHDDRRLFEMLVLEGAQAGLSWITVLKKRERYREVFDTFDAEKIATYDDTKIALLLQDPGIIRNRLKIQAAITNARAALRVRDEFGSFDRYIWQFVDGKPMVNHWQTLRELRSATP
jgi:DNA-3-methyladenine glycosylase I